MHQYMAGRCTHNVDNSVHISISTVSVQYSTVQYTTVQYQYSKHKQLCASGIFIVFSWYSSVWILKPTPLDSTHSLDYADTTNDEKDFSANKVFDGKKSNLIEI